MVTLIWRSRLSSTNNLSILLGNGDGTFQTHVDYPAGTLPLGVLGADLNGDGKLDLVTANFTSNNVSVLLGSGDGTFQRHVDFGAGSGPAQLAIGDFNADGRLDIATANNLDDTVSVLSQTTGGLTPGERRIAQEARQRRHLRY